LSHDIETWRAQARAHAAQGRPAEALELHRRYFAASRAIPSLYGVRLSFALSDWAELAETFPPARQALREARRAAADRLLPSTAPTSTAPADTPSSETTPDGELPPEGTSGDAFAEVAAISEALAEASFAVDLFAELDATAPDTAADCAIAAHDLLVRQGRHDLARRYLTDPVGKVGRLAQVLQMRLNLRPLGLDERAREDRRREAVRDYATGVREILLLLAGPEDGALAEATRRRALEGVAWGHVRDEVDEALRAG
jgi:hypothetical protein